MSKAFTRDDGAAPALLRRQAPAHVPGQTRNLTPEGRTSFLAELAQLESERLNLKSMPGVDVPQRAAEVEARIAFLKAVLEATRVVTPDAGQSRAFFGAWVELEDLEHPTRAIFRLVGPDEADARRGLVSTDSPLGQALLGKEEGDEVVVRRPRGPATFTVVAVSYQPLP